MEQITALQRIAAAATKGEWYLDKVASCNGAPIIRSPICQLGNSRDVAKVLYHSGSEDPEVHANAIFIATFNPALVTELLGELARLRQQVNNE